MLLLENQVTQQRVDVVTTSQVALGFHSMERDAGHCFCSMYVLPSSQLTTTFPDREMDHVVKQIPKGSVIVKGVVGKTACLYINPGDEQELAH